MVDVQQSQLDAAGASAERVIVKCSGLTKNFRDFWMRNRVRAVDNIDLEVRRGEVFGLLGPNGSGKSTTIKMILGLLRPSRGRIVVFGKTPEDVAIKKQIGYLPEESYLYRFLNARETLDYYGRLFHQDRHQRQRRIETLLTMVGLDAVQRRPVGEYSKGMQRRIGLAQALINDPQLLILDEPTTGLDPIGTRQIKDLILTLKARGKTILLCSHLLADVEDVCDRVAIMFGGKVQRHGTVDELLVDEHATTLRTSELDEETIAELRAVLERRGQRLDHVGRPRQRLEGLFLEIVHEAQTRGQATSGAASGGRIADFLSGDPEAQTTERLIDELVSAPVSAPASEPEPEPAGGDAEAQAGDEAVIEELTGATPPKKAEAPFTIGQVSEAVPAPRPASAPAAAKPQAAGDDDEEPDQSFIDALLNVTPRTSEGASGEGDDTGGGAQGKR